MTLASSLTTKVTSVTTESTLTTSEDEVRISTACSNQCGGSGPDFWCGTKKKDTSGKVVRCVQQTVKGENCVDSCEKKGKQYECLTNQVQLSGKFKNSWWDYCSLDGYTTNQERCTDTCATRGEKYYWCHTSKDDKTIWDYCSPQGRVRPIQYTINGGLCTSECGKNGKDYYWCFKSIKYCTGKSCDDNWDYCSTSDYTTKHGTKCQNRCGKHGEDYTWCKTVDGSWDYCSVSPKIGVDVSDHIELTIYGVKCVDKCHRAGDYYWCNQYGGGSSDTWDYCSPDPKYTVHREKCTDACATRGESYNWCRTATSWDYCSPKGTPGNTRQYTSGPGGKIFFALFIIPILIICCIVIKKACC